MDLAPVLVFAEHVKDLHKERLESVLGPGAVFDHLGVVKLVVIETIAYLTLYLRQVDDLGEDVAIDTISTNLQDRQFKV